MKDGQPSNGQCKDYSPQDLLSLDIMTQSSEEPHKSKLNAPQANNIKEKLGEQNTQPVSQVSDIVRRRLHSSVPDKEGFIDQVQGLPHVPKDGASEQNKPCQDDENIVVKDPSEDPETNVESKDQETKRDAYTPPYQAL
ncbi:MAG: hypothetical protein Q9181_000329 [Wetmoreana brouardii]